eukprot:403334975
MKQNKRMMERASRKIDRERQKIEMNEKKQLKEIQKLAKMGQHGAAKVLAKDVARMRSQVTQYYAMSSQLKAMSMKMSTMHSYTEIMKGLAGSTNVLQMMNEQMNIQQIQTVLKDFTKESMKQGINQEAIDDAMSMGMDNVDEEADNLYENILGEIGLEYSLEDPTKVKPKLEPIHKQEEVKQDLDDLEARLAALKN